MTPTPHIDSSGLIALRCGLLEPEVEEAWTLHFKACEECQELSERFSSAEILGGHIPKGVLVRWPKVTETVSGLERFLLRRHLGDCEECRDALRFLGHPVELATRLSLELSFDPFEELDREAADQVRARRLPVRNEKSGSKAPSSSGLHLFLMPTLPLRVVRSGGSAVNVFQLAPDARAAVLVPMLPKLPEHALAVVTLESPEGHTLLEETRSGSELAELTLLLTSDEPLATGDYSLRIAIHDAEFEYRFEIHNAPD